MEILVYISHFSHNTTRSWMFRHSDGNKNSWEREKANKAFLSIHHHHNNWRLHFIKIFVLRKMCFCPILLWWHGRGSQNSGIPRELPCLTFASSYSQISPPLRICFCPSDTLFQPFWPEFVRHLKSSYSSRQSFPVAAENKNVAQ